MAIQRRAFYSFKYDEDGQRASLVRNIGVVTENRQAIDNEWESVRSSSEPVIKQWINSQIDNRSVVIVLIGASTAGEKWINYEIRRGWNENKGVLGIHIHKLNDFNSNQSRRGNNPFRGFSVRGKSLTNIVPTYDPPQSTSRGVYGHIEDHIADWIEEAIEVRKGYSPRDVI